MTTPKQIEAARNVAARLAEIPGVLSSVADDWSDYGSFSLFVTLEGRFFDGYFIPKGEDLRIERCGRYLRFHVSLATRAIRRILKQSEEAGEIWSFDLSTPKGHYHKILRYTEFDGYDTNAFHISFRVPEDEKVVEPEKYTQGVL